MKILKCWFVFYVLFSISYGIFSLIESSNLEDKLYADTVVNKEVFYVTVKKEYLEELSVVDTKITNEETKGNSYLGKFFLRDKESSQKENTKVTDIYYFTKAEFGYKKQKLSDVVVVDDEKWIDVNKVDTKREDT